MDKNNKMKSLAKELSSCDKVIIRSRDKAQYIVAWYKLYEKELTEYDFKLPFERGCIEFADVDCGMYFEPTESGLVRIQHYNGSRKIVALSELYDPVTGNCTAEVEDSDYIALKLKKLILADRPNATGTCFRAIISAMVYHKDDIVPKIVREGRGWDTKKHKKNKSSKKAKLSTTKRVYVLSDYKLDPVETTGSKRRYTKPKSVVRVRGHWRTYKNGKRVWIEPFDKYKEDPYDRGETKNYIL